MKLTKAIKFYCKYTSGHKFQITAGDKYVYKCMKCGIVFFGRANMERELERQRLSRLG